MSKALQRAAVRNDTKKLLAALPLSTVRSMTKALNVAILKGSKECVAILLNERIQPSRSCVGIAVKHGYREILDILLRVCGNIYELNNGLVVAVRIGDITAAKRLLQSKWRPDGPDIPGACVNFSQGGLTTLDIAVKNGHDDMARFLVECGAKPIGGYIRSRMEKAVIDGDVTIVKYLTELGLKDEFYLRLASQYGREEVVAFLLDSNIVDVNSTSINGRTALMLASMWGRENVVRLLLKHGADVNATFKINVHRWGHTSLMWAVESKHEVVVDILLRAGARIEAKSLNGETAYDIAIRYGFQSIAQKLNTTEQTRLSRKRKLTKLKLKRRISDSVGRNRLQKRRRRGPH